jgi:hypothetical protein
LITSDAGALLLGATDRAIDLIDRFASCFHDQRRPEWIEHEVATLVGQRVFAIALGYEDLNDNKTARGRADAPIACAIGAGSLLRQILNLIEHSARLTAVVDAELAKAGERRPTVRDAPARLDRTGVVRRCALEEGLGVVFTQAKHCHRTR